MAFKNNYESHCIFLVTRGETHPKALILLRHDSLPRRSVFVIACSFRSAIIPRHCRPVSSAVIEAQVQGLVQLQLDITAVAGVAAPSDSSLVLGGSHRTTTTAVMVTLVSERGAGVLGRHSVLLAAGLLLRED